MSQMTVRGSGAVFDGAVWDPARVAGEGAQLRGGQPLAGRQVLAPEVSGAGHGPVLEPTFGAEGVTVEAPVGHGPQLAVDLNPATSRRPDGYH